MREAEILYVRSISLHGVFFAEIKFHLRANCLCRFLLKSLEVGETIPKIQDQRSVFSADKAK